MTVASTAFLATIPSPDRGVWHLGPIPLRAYALCIIAGIILAIWWGERRWIKRGGTAGTVIDIAVFAVPFGLVGGRLYHVATDWHLYFGEGKDPLDALRIWDGGLGIWGAIALGAVGAWIGCRVKGVPLPAYADAIAPGIVVAQALGRVGNYFNQELYGAHTDLPWGLEIYQRVNEAGETDNLNGVATNHIPLDMSPVHPTFLYELLWNLLVAGLVVWVDRKYRLGHGRAFAVYVMGYTLGRTWIELMRTDTATHVAGVRINVWVSILVFLGAAVYFVLARSRGEREDPASLRGKDAPPLDEPGTEAKPDGDAKDEKAEDEPDKADSKKADADTAGAKKTDTGSADTSTEKTDSGAGKADAGEKTGASTEKTGAGKAGAGEKAGAGTEKTGAGAGKADAGGKAEAGTEKAGVGAGKAGAGEKAGAGTEKTGADAGEAGAKKAGADEKASAKSDN